MHMKEGCSSLWPGQRNTCILHVDCYSDDLLKLQKMELMNYFTTREGQVKSVLGVEPLSNKWGGSAGWFSFAMLIATCISSLLEMHLTHYQVTNNWWECKSFLCLPHVQLGIPAVWYFSLHSEILSYFICFCVFEEEKNPDVDVSN